MILEIIQIWLPIIKDTVTCLAAGVAAVVAILGLQEWKKQLKGKAEYELAQRLLVAVYKVRDEFSRTRQPIRVGEGTAKTLEKEGLKSESRGIKLVYEDRLQKLEEAFSALDSIEFEAEAIWGKEVKDSLKKLRDCRAQLVKLIRNYVKNFEQPMSEVSKQIIYDVLYEEATNGGWDDFSAEIAGAIQNAEIFLKPRLMAKSPAYRKGFLDYFAKG